MSDGTFALDFPAERRRQRPRIERAEDLAVEREEWQRELVAAEVARLKEMTERAGLGRGRDDY